MAADAGERSGRRVVVTGLGAITPLGQDLESTWQGLLDGRSGVGKNDLIDVSDMAVKIAAQVPGWDQAAHFGARRAKHLDRVTQFGLVAAEAALAHSGLEIGDENASRVGVLFGSGIGGISTLEEQVLVMADRGPSRISPFLIPKMIINMIAGEVSIATGAKGPNSATVTACAASAHAIGDAVELIRRGRADAMIAGGAEAAICRTAVGAFASMKALSTRNDEPERASRPFDAERDGFVMGEGGACLILEEREAALARGAEAYAEIVGYGMSGDAYHITAPSPDGDGAARAMAGALDDAGLDSAAVGYINAHGTSTPYNDQVETVAIKSALGEQVARSIAVSSTKSMTGHLLGAAGAVEAAVCIKAILTGVIPPTINLENPDPDCDLDYVANAARDVVVDLALSNSFGFGGQNACLAIARA